MMSGNEERAIDADTQVVHYLHRVWAENGHTLCGAFIWFTARSARERRIEDSVFGRRLAPDDLHQVTCMECIILQVPR